MPRTVRSLKSNRCQDPTALKAVLFDLDGTLIDTLEMIRASLRYATETVLGRVIPDDELMHNVGIPLIKQMGEFDASRADELLATYREHNLRVHDAMVREYPYVEESLERLVAQGLRLGIVTSKSGTMAQRGLERFSLGRFFETVVSCDDVTRFKPDPYPLQYAAGQLGVDARDCAYVGDSPHDMAAARDAECLSVAALWGVASRERLIEQDACYAARSMLEVADIFAGEGESHRVERE
jgi:pyrophosphatase PpaX